MKLHWNMINPLWIGMTLYGAWLVWLEERAIRKLIKEYYKEKGYYD